MKSENNFGNQDIKTILWLARIGGSAIVLFMTYYLVFFFVLPGVLPPTWALIGWAPLFGACVGYVIAWRRHLLGGIISLFCVGLFPLWALAHGSITTKESFVFPLIIGGPGILFVIFGLLSRMGRRTST